MDERIDIDYGDFLILEREEVEPFIQPAREYVQYIKDLLKDYLKEE